MPAPVSASAGVARPLTPLGVKLALAACAPPALPLAAVPVVLRLLSRWPPCSSSSACSPQLAALPVVLHPLPQLAALPVVLRLLPQLIARPSSSACSPSWPPGPSSSIRSPPLIAPPVVLQRFRQMGKSTSNYGPVLCFFGQSSRKKVSKSAAFCQLCTVSRAKTVSLGKTLYEV